jgi:hypothetical protein
LACTLVLRLIVIVLQRRQIMVRVIGIAISMASVAGIAFAGVVSVPELDASSGVAAIGLIAGGWLILRSRRKK